MTAVTQPRRPVEMLAAAEERRWQTTHQDQLRAMSRAKVMAAESVLRAHRGEYLRALRLAAGMHGVDQRVLARITEDERVEARIALLEEELARLRR